MTTLHIALLGPFTVTIDNHPVVFRTNAERALLAYLAAQQGIPHRRDTLATLLSPDRNDSDALTYLRNRLTRLRSAIDDENAAPSWLLIDRKQIALRTGDDIVIDVTRFAQNLAAVQSHAHRHLAACPTCLAHLDAAASLVRGELLAGLNFPSEIWEAWLLGQREALQQQALHAMTLLRDARIEQGDWPAVLAVAQRQLSLEPWLEAAHRAAMQAHTQLGNRNAALAQYEQCEALLWAELGVEPEEATQALQQQLLGAGLAAMPTTPIPDNLPRPIGRFVGRSVEQARLLQRLADPTVRLITLVGTGGVGKTRLALEVSLAIKANFPDGVWFVALNEVKGEAEAIKIAIGEAAQLGQGNKQRSGEQVMALLRNKQLLLILDNCEVVLDELGFLSNWLNRAPGVVILATSREPLNFGSEAVVLLDGLPTGHANMDEGELLFAERGQMARADFVVTAENLPQVRRICQLVDGLPLGIALAAAWVRRRSLAQIIDAINGSLDFLSTGLRDIDPRHRSMRAVFETSWQLLDVEVQAVLAALAIFPATFSAEAAAAVADATLFDLDLLCEKSLLQQQIEPERYSLHSLVRQFAVEKLSTRTPAVERALFQYFYGFARDHRDEYAALQPEWRNFVTAITKAHAQAAWQTVLDLVAVLDEPWFRQIRFGEMREGLRLALDAASALGDERVLAKVQLRLGEVTLELNDYEAAEAHLRAAMDRFIRLEEGAGIAHANYFLGRIKNERAQDDEALALFAESRRIFEEEADELGVAKTLNLMAVCHLKTYRELQTAQTLLEESIALQRRLPLTATFVETLRNLARVEVRAGAYAAAERTLDEALTVSRQQQDRGEYAAVRFEQLLFCKKRGQVDLALAHGQEALESFRQLGSLRWEALLKTQLGLLQQAKGQFTQALGLITDGLQIFDELGDQYEQAYSYYYLYKLYGETGEAAQSANAKAQALRLNQALNDQQLAARLA